MKKFTIFSIVLIGVFIVGCTSPTQRIAQHSMEIGFKQEDSIVLDLSNMAKQFALDKAVAQARNGCEGGDLDAVQVSVQNFADNFEKITWLQLQHERARRVLGISQEYIISQQGILDIMLREYREAEKIAAEDNPG
jgi:hypothetical protein